MSLSGDHEQPDAVDAEDRPFDLSRVVVNFLNVGSSYGIKVLQRDKARGQKLFDYEGVRRCVAHLTQKRGLLVVGVTWEEYPGHDDAVKKVVREVPADIEAMCESIELTPNVAGHNHKSADDEMTIKCAYRRNCRWIDNDNYRDWLTNMHDDGIRNWLNHCQEFLQMKYFFDSQLGAFDTLDGNIPTHWLALEPSRKKHRTGPVVVPKTAVQEAMAGLHGIMIKGGDKGGGKQKGGGKGKSWTPWNQRR